MESYEHKPSIKESGLNNSRFHWGNYRFECLEYTVIRSHSLADEDCHIGEQNVD